MIMFNWTQEAADAIADGVERLHAGRTTTGNDEITLHADELALILTVAVNLAAPATRLRLFLSEWRRKHAYSDDPIALLDTGGLPAAITPSDLNAVLCRLRELEDRPGPS
jgi:hypothetical protein